MTNAGGGLHPRMLPVATHPRRAFFLRPLLSRTERRVVRFFGIAWLVAMWSF